MVLLKEEVVLWLLKDRKWLRRECSKAAASWYDLWSCWSVKQGPALSIQVSAYLLGAL